MNFMKFYITKKVIRGLDKMKSRQRNCLKHVAGLLVVLLLSVLVPLTASAVDFTSLATVKRGLTYPTDTAISSTDGKMFVVDGITRKVLTYDSTYRYLGSITSVEIPVAVAVSPTGVFYVADNASKSVKILNPSSGEVTGYLKQAGTGNMATFELPRNIAVGADGTVYVVDQFADSIEVFDVNGSHVDTISGLTMPQDVVAAGGDLYIIDQPRVAENNSGGTTGSGSINASRIQIFDLAGKTFVADVDRTFPSFGNDTDTGQYISLKGIGVDSQNNVYVSDSFLQVIYKYTGDGEFLGPINEAVATPLGLTVSGDGRLLATSSYDGVVKVLGVDQVAGADTWMNEAPVADAGANQTVKEGTEFVLDGSGSSDTDGIASFSWTQTGGTLVFPENPFVTDSALITVTAPTVGPAGALLTFELVVTDAKAKQSASASTKVIVSNGISGSVVINDGVLYATNPVVSLSLDAPEAEEMRFANDNEPFTGTFYGYTTLGDWTLSDGDGTKIVNVEFKDIGGNTSTASSSIILDTQSPAVPEITDLNGAGGEFNWQPVGDADSYVFQYAANKDFTGAVTMPVGYNGLTMSLDGMESGTWYWRVGAVDAAGNTSGWSATGTFGVGPDCAELPATPQLAQPFNQAEDIPRTVVLESGDMSYPAECGEHLRTEWQVSKRSSFDRAMVMHVGTTLENLTAYQIPALVLEPETTYFWRVKQVASNGSQSDWSVAWSFTTEALYDAKGENGVLYVQPEGEPADASGEEIAIKTQVGDAGVRIKAIRVSAGVVTQTIQALDPNAIPDTVNKPASFPLGLLSFRLAVTKPGAYVQVKVLFSKPVPKDAEWYSYNADSGWHAYEGAVFNRSRKAVILNFQDGGIGDTDGVANGIIVNP
jgi:hypothetical protein